MQNSDTGFQLRVPGESNDSSVHILVDCRMWLEKRRSLHISRHDPVLFVLRVAALAFPQRFRVEAVRLGMAVVVAVANLDHPARLDAEMRASRCHGETVRRSYVQFPVDRSINGSEQEERRPTGSESRGNSF